MSYSHRIESIFTQYGTRGAHAFSRARREQSKQAGARNQRLDLSSTHTVHHNVTPGITVPVPNHWTRLSEPHTHRMSPHASASSHHPVLVCSTQRTQERLKARERRRKRCGCQRQTTAHTAADGAGRDSRRTHARPTCASKPHTSMHVTRGAHKGRRQAARARSEAAGKRMPQRPRPRSPPARLGAAARAAMQPISAAPALPPSKRQATSNYV